ncbi:MAG: LTA synthase family protein [Desulfuromonadales bacterium]|nr:LTA synthase family protein [Desulfuromonadales bacterium]MDW7757576.1 LTA synthase family protein [Desulfuromonadales bacterium]
MSRTDRFVKFLGPLLPIVAFFLTALSFLSLARLGLMAWKWDRIMAVDGLWTVLGYGLRMDVVLLCYAVSLPVLVALLLPGRKAALRPWRKILPTWLAFYSVFIVFMEAATPAFIDQYDSRPNRLFFEYLDHPKEVFATLWAAYKLPLLLAAVAVILLTWGAWSMSRRLVEKSHPWGWWRRLAVLPLIVLVLLAGARSSFSHRPANLSTVAFCNDPLVNQLGVSSAYSLGYAVSRLQDESDSVRFYGKMPKEEVFRRVHREMGLPETAFSNPDIPTLHHQLPGRIRQKPLNLVIILEESLGASYVQSLGGLPLTPELEKLSTQGLWFSQLYATGTRSIRGVEAVVTGFPPTPARSVVKLGLAQQNFFTLARLLKSQGYSSEFIYGGDSQFDNMRSFFLGNGFDRVIDEKQFSDWTFRGSWGVCDEDIFQRTHEELLAHADQPFFTFVFSVSNHSPFEFPDNRIALYEQPKNSRTNAVKYADYALGQFFAKARQASYWDNTLFLVVADHEDRVFGDELVPIKYFHIPALILGADIAPGRYDKVASQLDLPPTLLSLMGIESSHPMPGHDLLQLPGDDPGRAIMQFGNNQAYMVGEKVVIHTPDKAARQYVYRDGRLDESTEEPELVRDALAEALWPAIAYREQRYRIHRSEPAKDPYVRSDRKNVRPPSRHG